MFLWLVLAAEICGTVYLGVNATTTEHWVVFAFLMLSDLMTLILILKGRR